MAQISQSAVGPAANVPPAKPGGILPTPCPGTRTTRRNLEARIYRSRCEARLGGTARGGRSKYPQGNLSTKFYIADETWCLPNVIPDYLPTQFNLPFESLTPCMEAHCPAPTESDYRSVMNFGSAFTVTSPHPTFPPSQKKASKSVPRRTASWTRLMSFSSTAQVLLGIPSNNSVQKARSAISNSSGIQNVAPGRVEMHPSTSKSGGKR
ncbi:hypothetical protein BT67DRAFT_188311 [Trichocladium antarcticum]|uniref:Uncharacterized protein n=1 Tax=Trichocladium antarcticum TaxID=1450529 RepID=A0AAN6ZGJ2_9PEZI|nr:hypothetical protein BT67DRAFT_188311 [Trichocladium antarcticum]